MMLGYWLQVGLVKQYDCVGFFWVVVFCSYWFDEIGYIECVWDENNGDCWQEIVLIGCNMDVEGLMVMFDECLLIDEEFDIDECMWNEFFFDFFFEWQFD